MKKTHKQNLEIIKSHFIWDGRAWVVMHEMTLQPKGTTYYAVESTHFTGSRMNFRFISDVERESLLMSTEVYLNKIF